jgi:hypothetical protein
VLPLGSAGSTSNAPIAFVPNEPDTNFQWPSAPSFACPTQTPPPAAPRYSEHLLLCLQPPIASAVTRPDAV